VRQAVLLLVLAGASFLGGAFVNGPGLQWLQSRVLRCVGLHNAGEIASVDLKPMPSAGPGLSKPATEQHDQVVIQGPLAPSPSLILEDELPKPDVSDYRASLGADGKPGSNSQGSQPSRVSPSSKLLPTDPPTEGKSRDGRGRSSDSSVTPAGIMLPAGTSRASSRSGPTIQSFASDSSIAQTPLSTPLSGSTVAASPLSALTSGLGTQPATNGMDSWLILERKLQTLGVSRFTIMGEPRGRVVFSCLIPIAGRQAVAQQFEAEADDLVEAAQAAVRRIVLWRATQPGLK
jgi:hypothetical protein